MILKLAWRNIWRNKRRTLITIASVFFAVALAIIMMGIKEGMYDRMLGNVAGAYTGYVQIQHRDFQDERIIENSITLTEDITYDLSQVNLAEGHAFRLESGALASTGEFTKFSLVLGVDPDAEKELTKLNERVTDGEFLKRGEDALLLGTKLAKNLHVGVGDTVVLLSQGLYGVTAAGKYVIKGLVKLGSPDLNRRVIYLPLETAQKLYGAPNYVSSIVPLLKDARDIEKSREIYTEILDSNYVFKSWDEMMPEMASLFEQDRAEGYIMMTILYLVISFGIFGTVVMMLAERRNEMGILMAVGMKKGKLALTIVLELVILTLLGALVGILGGAPFNFYLHFNPYEFPSDMQSVSEEYGFEAVISSSIAAKVFLQQAFTVLLIALAISLYPIFHIYRLNPNKAMNR